MLAPYKSASFCAENRVCSSLTRTFGSETFAREAGSVTFPARRFRRPPLLRFLHRDRPQQEGRNVVAEAHDGASASWSWRGRPCWTAFAGLRSRSGRGGRAVGSSRGRGVSSARSVRFSAWERTPPLRPREERSSPRPRRRDGRSEAGRSARLGPAHSIVWPMSFSMAASDFSSPGLDQREGIARRARRGPCGRCGGRNPPRGGERRN